MAYSTQAELTNIIPEDSLIQLTDDEGAGVVNAGRITKAIADADAEIDLYCGDYGAPFTTVPPIIKKISADIALYNLYTRRVEEIPPARQARYDNAMSTLKDIAKGVVNLETVSTVGGPETNTTTADRKITLDTMTNY